MNNAISYERWRLLLMLVSIGAIGLLADNWIVAILLPSALYIIWSFYQLYALERWLRKGAVKKKAPDSGGAWGEIVQHIYRRQLAAAKSKKTPLSRSSGPIKQRVRCLGSTRDAILVKGSTI